MKKLFNIIRLIIALALLVTLTVFAGIRLMKIQVVDGEKYLSMAKRSTTATQNILAVRGEIVDANGLPLVQNRVSYNLIIEHSFFPSSKELQNEVIIKLIRLLEKDGLTWLDTTPITFTEPYEFLPDATSSEIARIKNKLRLNDYATAENCIDALLESYQISSDYTQEEQRFIAGVRYQMILSDFSAKTDYTFAKDIPISTVSKVHELRDSISGADILQDAVRVYAKGNAFPHGLGYVGPIYADEYEVLKSQGYFLTDTVGKSGIERSLESYLRGKTGEKKVTVSSDKTVTQEITTPETPGNTVKLTIDSEFQLKLQEILANHVSYLKDGTLTKRDNQNKVDLDFSDAGCAAAVVIDVKTGAIKGMATTPSYDINDLLTNYSEILNAENSPLYNRATDGIYRPGSVMKTVTAISALNEGIITPEETFECNGEYEFLDITVRCTSKHGRINVTTAIEKSCNIYFYQVIQKVGLDKFLEYQAAFGLGEDIGLEISSSKGYLANPDTFANFNMTWTVGQLLQAAIGQSEVGVTPLQMAVLASTIANNGVRYQPYLVDSVWDYNMTTILKKTEPAIINQLNSDEKVFSAVIEGMIKAGENTTSQTYYGTNEKAAFEAQFSTLALPQKVAIKTGTPQASNKATQNSTVVGFYPADNPEIAFAVVIENGDYAKYTVRKIIEAYYGWETAIEDLGDNRFKSIVITD